MCKKILSMVLLLSLSGYSLSLAQATDDEYQPGLLEELDKREAVAAEEKQPNLETEEDRLDESKDEARIGEIQQEKSQAMERIEQEGEYGDYGSYD